ncbi:MAG: sugar phosphate isomerase/epimerase family protein [Candidatus Bathyarchaeia archaeon]
MRFSQSSFVYLNYPLDEAICRLHKFGYDGVEVWGGRPHAYRRDLNEHIGELVKLLNKHKMSVSNFVPAQFRYPSILCSSNEAIRRSSVEYIKDAIDTAIQLNSPYLSLCPGMVIYGEDLKKGWNQLRKSIMELLEYSSKYDLTLLIEPAHATESNLIRTVEEGLRIVKEIGSERLGILLDTGHAYLNGEDLTEAVRTLNKNDIPFHIHIDDNNGDSDSHMIPGEGSIDFKPFADTLKEIDYQGFVSAELGFQYTLNPDQAVKETLRFLKKIFL